MNTDVNIHIQEVQKDDIQKKTIKSYGNDHDGNAGNSIDNGPSRSFYKRYLHEDRDGI
jgi:hypothetical protein